MVSFPSSFFSLFKGFQNQAKRQQSIIQQDILKNQVNQLNHQIHLQIEQSYYQVKEARSAIESSIAEVKNATEAYRIIRKKYDSDRANYLELTESRTRMTNAKLQLNINHFNYWIQKAELEWSTGNY